MSDFFIRAFSTTSLVGVSRSPLVAVCALLFGLFWAPSAQAQVPQVSCEHGVCFRFPAESHEPFVASQRRLGGPFHYDNGCEGIDGPCVCSTYWGADVASCYGGHHGTDYMLEDWFRTMRQEIAIVAAADGEIVAVEDDNYDKCHFSARDLLFDDSHDGNYCGWEYNPETGEIEDRPIINNYVIVRHWNGRYYVYSRTLHLAQGSIPSWIKAALADGYYPRVSCGDTIGYVGSAGKSYAPHVHFETRTWGEGDVSGVFWDGSQKPPSLDPYCGPYVAGADTRTSMWTDLPSAAASAGVPHGLPGLSCQAPYDPERFTDLPARCSTESTGR